MQAGAGVIALVERPSTQSVADSDIESVEQAKHDPAAFGLLYDRYAGRIYRYVYSRVRDRSLAEDITEEVFLNALKSIAKYRHTGTSFAAWLYRIAGNAIVSHYRRVKPEVELESLTNLADPSDGVLDEVVRRDRSRRIWQAIEKLPPRQREAVTLKFSADLSFEGAARVMGKSPAAIKLLVYRAVQSLRRDLVPLEA